MSKTVIIKRIPWFPADMSREWLRDRYARWSVILIAMGLLLKLILASYIYITGDACWYYNIIRFIAQSDKLPLFESLGRGQPYWHPPVFFLLGTVFYKVFGIFGTAAAEFSVRLLSPLASAILLLYVFLIFKKLYNSRIAFFSVLFLSFVPDFIYESVLPYFDVLVAMFAMMSIYYMLTRKVAISGLIMAIAVLTKFNALFAVPIPLFILFLQEREKGRSGQFAKKALLYLIIACLLGSIWFIRNYMYIGNPVYPYFEKDAGSVGVINLYNLINPFSYLKLYLSFFGVPDGFYQNLFFINIPFQMLFIALWFAATVVFILPAFIGVAHFSFRKRNDLIIMLWLMPFLGFTLLTFISDVSVSSNIFRRDVPTSIIARYLIIIFPLVAVSWAKGVTAILQSKSMEMIEAKRVKHGKQILLAIFVLVIFGFVLGEFMKAYVVRHAWSFYQPDFSFVKSEIPIDAKILVPYGSCYQYNFERQTEVYLKGAKQYTSLDDLKHDGISYVLVNQDNTLYGIYPETQAQYAPELIAQIKRGQLVYQNLVTKTSVYKI